MTSAHTKDARWAALSRKRVAIGRANGEPCSMCGNPIDYTLDGRNKWGATSDHIIPIAYGGELIVQLEELNVAHHSCNSRAGVRIANARKGKGKPPPEKKNAEERNGKSSAQNADPALSDPANISLIHPSTTSGSGDDLEGLATGWLDPTDLPWGLDPLPADAVWPRLMTAKHPRATSTYGPEFVAWANERPEMHPKKTGGLRWWQVLAAYRALEHDEHGALVWRTVILTVGRQSGKSWLTRALLTWRMEQADRFDEPQTCVSTAHKLLAAQEVWRSAARWYAADGTKVRYANGEQMIELDNGSRWLLQAANDGLAVGYSLSMGLIDEAWRVRRDIFDGALLPTMSESESPQAWLVSTAGDAASDLMLSYRTTALMSLDRPESVLLLEWSANPGADLDDESGWRAASPHWDERRIATVKHARATMTSDEFRTQYMNQWVKRKLNANMWIDETIWADAGDAALRVPTGPLAIAVEDFFGRGAAAAAAALVGDAVHVVGSLFPDRTAAYRWASGLAATHPNSRLIVGLSLKGDAAIERIAADEVEGFGAGQTRAALGLMRELMATGKFRHDAGAELTDQAVSLQVTKGPGGLTIPPRHPGRTDLIRCVGWATLSAHRSPNIAPAVF